MAGLQHNIIYKNKDEADFVLLAYLIHHFFLPHYFLADIWKISHFIDEKFKA